MNPLALLAPLALSLALAAPPSAGGGPSVHVVGPGGFADVQAAVDAAADGDVVLVQDGTWAPFVVDGKSLSVVANGELALVLALDAPGVVVRNLAAGQRVALDGLEVLAGTFASAEIGIDLDANAGAVWIQDVDATGAGGALRARASAQVVVARSRLAGLHLGAAPPSDGDDGGPGLLVEASTVVLHGCEVAGGSGGAASTVVADGGDGGDGALVRDGLLVAFGSTFAGADGGGSPAVETSFQGNGGDGLRLETPGSAAATVDSTFAAGAAGAFGAATGAAGTPVQVVEGLWLPLPGDALAMTASTPVRETTQVDLAFAGPPGAPLLLGVGLGPTLAFPPAAFGPLLVAGPHVVLPLGALDASGAAATSLPLGPLPPGVLVLEAFAQPFHVDPLGTAVLGAPALVTILDNAL